MRSLDRHGHQRSGFGGIVLRFEIVDSTNNVAVRLGKQGLPSFGRNLTFRINSVPHQVSLSKPSPDGKINVAIQGQHFEAYLTAVQQGSQQPFPENREELIQRHVGTKIVLAPMSGRITSLVVRTGQRVHAGQALVILEAMKMENEIISPWDGTIDKIHVGGNRSQEERADHKLGVDFFQASEFI